MAIVPMERIGNWEQRDFHGFIQVREVYESGGKSNWHFNVTGFDVHGQPDTCNVLMADKQTKTVCKVDGKGFLTVLGRRYSSRHWDH